MKKILIITLFLACGITSVFAVSEIGYGITLLKDNDKLVIQNVTPNSNAAKAGLIHGQNIIKLNGKKIIKLSDEILNNIDSSPKLKITTEDNKSYNLLPENIAVLKAYNNVLSTFNNSTKYKVSDYKTDKIILANKYDAHKNVRYLNAYFNYADIISIENAKLYVDLFKVTDKNVKEAINLAQNSNLEYYNLYKSLFTGQQKYDIYGLSLKHFLELAIYNDINNDLIKYQLSEFNNEQKNQFAQITYNTKIVANLYSLAMKELSTFATKHNYSTGFVNSWNAQFGTENRIYNSAYQELYRIANENKINSNNPGDMANNAQIIAGVIPNEKIIKEAQMLTNATNKGYNPQDNAEYKSVRVALQKQKQTELAAQKRKEADEAKKKAAKKYVHKTFPASTNFVVSSAQAWNACKKQGDDYKCEEFKDLVDQGIKVYTSKRESSYAGIKNYCTLVQLRLMHMSWGDMNLFAEDQYNNSLYCKYLY